MKVVEGKSSEFCHKEILSDLEKEVPKWSECDKQRKLELTKMWQDKWNWKNYSTKTEFNSENSPPWQAVRLIGHRGSGKTQRPVM